MRLFPSIINSLKMSWQIYLVDAYKRSPIGKFYENQSFDGRQPHNVDKLTHLAVYAVNVWAFAAMRAIARDVSSTPLLVQKETIIDGEPQWVTQHSGPLFEIFDRPNPNEGWDMVSERWILSLLGSGDGYLTFEDKKELWFIRPDWIKVTTTAGQLDGYVVSHKGLTEKFDLNQIIHIRLANPRGEYYGMPPSMVIKKAIMTKISQQDYILNYFNKGGIPGMVITTEKSIAPDQMTILRKEFDKAYVGKDKHFGVMLFDNGMTATRVPPDIKSLIPNELDLMVMREVLAAYGVPPVKIGVLDGATYANAREQDQTYQRGTIEPIRRLVENVLRIQLVREGFPGFRLHYDRQAVPGLQEDAEKLSVRTNRDYRSGLIMRREARKLLGYDPLEDEEMAEEFFSQSAAPQIVEVVGSDVPGKTLALPPGTKALDPARNDLWKAFDIKKNPKARIIRKHINRFLDGQLQRLIDKLHALTADGIIMARLGLYIHAKIHEDDKLAEGLLRDLFDLEAENAILTKDIAPVLESLAEQAGQEALDQFGIEFQFNVQDPAFEAIQETLVNRITRINKATQNDVRRMVGQSFDAGESLAELTDRLTNKFKQFSKVRSKTIAATETGRLSNAAAHNAYGQAGVKKKQWLSVQDGNVRDQHIFADGEIVDMNKHFIQTGESLMYPNDPNGSPGNTINCRCVSVPIVEVD